MYKLAEFRKSLKKCLSGKLVVNGKVYNRSDIKETKLSHCEIDPSTQEKDGVYIVTMRNGESLKVRQSEARKLTVEG